MLLIWLPTTLAIPSSSGTAVRFRYDQLMVIRKARTLRTLHESGDTNDTCLITRGIRIGGRRTSDCSSSSEDDNIRQGSVVREMT
jgi:hypothetical protein